MIAQPTITISHVDELFTDELGELWSPATVTIVWPPTGQLRAPTLIIEVIAPARAEMTLEQLREAHLQAAHDVLSAALIALEVPPTDADQQSYAEELLGCRDLKDDIPQRSLGRCCR
jgi:hypothetical protein